MTWKEWKRIVILFIFLILIPGTVNAAVITSDVPISDGFDFPVGWPNGNGYRISGWDFLEYSTNSNSLHPGEDWNGVGGGDTDLGDPVYAVSNGYVIAASDYNWGNIILIKHKLQNGTIVWSQYAHLKDMLVNSGDNVRRGQQIGTIGKSGNQEYAHLHFEIRKSDLSPDAWVTNQDEAQILTNYYDPSDFISSNRPEKMPLIGDWDNNGVDTTGIFDPNTSTFLLDNGVNKQLGEFGDFPIIGDWDRDGFDSIGVYRPKTAQFFFDNNNDGESDEQPIVFGNIGDFPIIGDWDGDGDDNIGVFRSSDRSSGLTTFYFDSNNDGEADSDDINFGLPADTPIVGDWDNTGTDDVGVFRRNDSQHDNNAVFYFCEENFDVTIDLLSPFVVYGMNEDASVTGKWDEDRLTKIGVYRPSTEEFIFNRNLLVNSEPDAIEGRSGGPDYFGYTFKDSNVEGGPTYDWIEISGTGTLILPDSDDFYIDGIPVGFFFNYYGTDYSQVSITNNGITLASGGTGQWTNQPIGSSTPHNFIAPFWDDIVTWRSAGAVYYQVIGEAPNRKFVVEWFDNQHYSSSPSGITFEAILYEGTNDIKFQYKDVDFGSDSYNNGASATVGIEGAEGRGLQYSYNEPVISPNTAILFKFPTFSGTNMYISKNAPASKDHGSLMTYTLYYNNFGSVAASNVVVQDTLPSNVEFVSASEGGTYDPATRKVTWNIGSVAPLRPGSRTVSVRVPDSVSVGTVIQNTASISTMTLETSYVDNNARASTKVTGSNLPPNVGVEPNNGGTGTPSIYWHNPITFSYRSDQPATAVDITIHIDDGGPDITGSMTPTTGSTTEGSDWTYTTTFYPRHGRATVSYSVQSNNAPYSPGYDVRGSYGDFITANDIEAYIENNYPTSPMLDETNIGSSFINAGNAYGIDPAFLVATAELEGRFGTEGWAVSHPEAHNTFGWGVPSGSTPVNSINSADSWGEMVNRVAERIANGPYYFNSDLYTVEQIRNVYAGYPNPQGIANFMNELYTFSQTRHSTVSFDIYIDPAGYIYDIETGERIAGASVWLQRPDGLGDWENVPTGELTPVAQPDVNPQITSEDGMYQWDVLEGSYRVHVEAPGYEPANSIVVSVPPPVFDLHVGLVPINVPNVPPVADAGGPYEGTAGDTIRLSGSNSYDPDEDRGDSIVSYEWDLDEDGFYDDATGEVTEYVWNGAYSGQISLRVTDSNGEVGTDSAMVNIQDIEQDLIPPTILSATFYPANTTAGSTINVTVNATDNTDLTEVIAGDIQLIKTDDIWQGSITAPSSIGSYSLLIKAKDAAGNVAEASVPYRVVQLSGGANIAVSPRSSSIVAGNSVTLNIKVKNTQNIDDIFKVNITVSELPAANQANIDWFSWTEQSVKLRAGEEILLPLEVEVPDGTALGLKLFRANVNSETSVVTGFDTGYLKVV